MSLSPSPAVATARWQLRAAAIGARPGLPMLRDIAFTAGAAAGALHFRRDRLQLR